MLFITCRFPTGSIRSKVGRKFIFDLKNNAPSNSIFFCQREADQSITEIGGINFLNILKQSSARQILLYIHGFSNLPEQVFTAVSEFQSLCDQYDPKEVLVVPIIWPCDDDIGIVQDYWDDQKSADNSDVSFARGLEKFFKWQADNLNSGDGEQCLKRINVLAHSMGNRVLRETLNAWNRYDLAHGVPLIFRNTFLVAADIENKSLQNGEIGSLICDASRNVVVYFASDDLALRSSKIVNNKDNFKNAISSKRLGHTGPDDPTLTPKNVYSIDCDEVNTKYDQLKGHTYFRSGTTFGKPGVVFDHIFKCIKYGRVEAEVLEKQSVLKLIDQS